MTDAAWQALITISTALITALAGFGYRWLKAYYNDRYEDRKARHAELLAAASPSSKPEIERNAPSPPPDLGPLALVFVAILGGSGVAYTASEVATLRGTIQEAASCPRKCPDGQECVDVGNGRRVCGKLAKPPAPTSPSPPESAAIFSSTPLYYRRSPFERDDE